MSVVRPNEIPPESKPVTYALWGTGALFLLLGILALIFPQALADFIGLDGMFAYIFAGQLVLIGLVDILWLPGFLIKSKQKQQEQNKDDTIN